MQTVHQLKQINSDLDQDLKSALNGQLSSEGLSEQQQAWLGEKAVLESQLLDLREKLAGLENTALDSMSRAEELTNDVKQLEDDREILLADRQKYKSRYNEHKKEARRHIQDLSEEIDRLTDALEHTNTELDGSHLMNQKLKKDLESLKQQKTDAASPSSTQDWEEQRKEYEDEISQRERLVHNLTLERQALQQQYKDAQHKIELLLEQMDDSHTSSNVHTPHRELTNSDDEGYTVNDDYHHQRTDKHNSFIEHVAAA